VHDAEDVLQETLVAAWRGLAGFEERSSLRTWLYRIATNRCLNSLRASARRSLPVPTEPPWAAEPTRRGEPLWLTPYQSGEVAGMLSASEASVNSALQRARATMSRSLPRASLPRSVHERDVAERFATAFAGGDVDGVVALLTDDAWFTMPPVTLEYQGPAAIAAFLRSTAVWRGARGYRLVATGANRQPAFGLYMEDSSVASRFLGHGMIVLTLRGDRISAITRFIDEGVMGLFGLPMTLDG
jgi:hypothetical protein